MIASLREQLARARVDLVAAGLAPDDAGLDAEVLARHVLGWDRAQLLTRWHLPPPEPFAPLFATAIARRAGREPVAHITGHREFWGLDFQVTRDVLIPRPETELIVELATVRYAGRPDLRVVDVGTGSGAIAVALALELPSARVVAIDCSAAALAVAEKNIAQHGVAARVHPLRGNLLDPIAGPVDLIVSNPPYVPRRDAAGLQPEVARFEPADALFADEDGLAVLRALIDAAWSRLARDGLLIVEFGAGQDDRLRELAAAQGWAVEVFADLAGIPRVAVMSHGSHGRQA